MKGMLHYKDGKLFCEDYQISKLADKVGTPFYLYSQETLLSNYRRIKKAFSKASPLIAYSVKANSNLSILKLFAKEGSGFDIVSGGELHRVIKAGGNPGKVIYAGVGKSVEELQLAIKSKIMMLNLESVAEASVLSEIAKSMKSRIRVALRINPDVEAHTHEYITTGKKENKFGVSYKSAPEIIKKIAALPNIEFVGLHVHVGSQILNLGDHVRGVKRLITLINELRALGIEIRTVNIGGGYGIAYQEREKAMNVEKVAEKIIPIIRKTGCRLILEPGRFIVGPAGALITRVIYVKKGDEKDFAIVDAGMNDLIRPALYKAYHRIITVNKPKGARKREYDIVGPICESSDFFGKNRMITPLSDGDLIAIGEAGAYGFVMASNYNTRRRPPEVLINGKDYYIIKKRERYNDLLRGEQFPPYLK